MSRLMLKLGGGLAVAGLLAIAYTAITTGKAQAVVINEFINSDNTWHPSEPWYNAYNSVSYRGFDDDDGDGVPDRSSTLMAPDAVFKAFYKVAGVGATSRTTFDITIVGACQFDLQTFTWLPAAGHARASIERLDAAGNPTVIQSKTNINGTDCSGNDLRFTINRADLTVIPDYYGTEFAVIQIHVEKLNGSGTRWFRVRSEDDGLVTFKELSRQQTSQPGTPGYGTAFSVQDAFAAQTSERRYVFRFSPDCQYVRQFGNTGYLKWFDADWNTFNEQGTFNISFTLRRYDRAGNLNWETTVDGTTPTNIGNDDDFREIPFPINGPDDIFVWQWENVNQSNGIQLWMPFSELQEGLTQYPGCDEPPQGNFYNADCNTVTGWAVDPDRPNDFVDVIGRVDGDFNTGFAAGQATANQPSPDGRGNHAFQFAYSGPKDGSTHQLFLYGIDIDDAGNRGGPVLLTPQPIIIPICVPPAPFILEPVPTSIDFNGGDPESPGAVTFNSQIQPTGTIPPPGIELTVERIMTVIRQAGARSQQTLGTTTSRIPAGGRSFADPVSAPAIQGLNLTAGDLLCIHLYVYDTYSGMADTAGNVPVVNQRDKVSQQLCERIVNKPYVKSYGADVWAGGEFGSSNCQPTNPVGGPPRIKTFARQLGTNVGGGASAEFAAFAMGLIDGDTASKGFFTASQRSAGQVPARPLIGLTFANTTGSWGGGFATQSHCIPEFFDVTKLNPTVLAPPGGIVDVSLLADGQYSLTAPPGAPIELLATQPIRNQVAIYVTGDVFLRRLALPGIVYQANGWASQDDIPSLFVMANNGNIYVDANMDQLDGAYIAQHNPAQRASTGLVYTCAHPVRRGPYDPAAEQGAFLDPGGCGRAPLRVNGVLVGREMRLQRAVNSLRDGIPSPGEFAGNSRAAEIVSLMPEFYLSRPALKPRGGDATGSYDSITTLPPIY